MKLKSTWLLLTIALLSAIVGCSNNPSDTGTVTNDQLAADFGGYDATAEAPAFGDAELLEMSAGEGEYSDPLLGTASSDSIIANPDAGLFHFRAVWGQLEYDSTFTTPTDWKGSITISRGAAIVRRLIRFEPATDSLLPRTDRKLVEWESTTTVHNDGISVDFYIPPPGPPSFDSSWVIDDDGMGNVDSTLEVDTVYAEDATLTIEAGQFNRTFTLAELAALDEIVELDDGNAVALQAHRIYRLACPRGFLRGKWGFDDENQGRFRGEWMSQHGFLQGWVKGTFDRTANGGKVFYGKWITKNGHFEGLLKGRWGFHPNRHADMRAFEVAGGWMKGFIYSEQEVKIGQLKGIWKSADHPVHDHYFQARWKLNCGEYNHDGMDDDEVDYGDHDRDRDRDSISDGGNYGDNGGDTEG